MKHLILAMLVGASDIPPRMVHLQVTLFEVPTTEVAGLLEETAAKVDHTAQLDRLEQAGTRVVASASIEGKSGQRSTIEMVTMLSHVTEFAARADGSTEGRTREVEPVGLTVEIDPVIALDGKTLDLNLSIVHTATTGASRTIPLGTLAGKRVESRVQDFVAERWTTSTTLLSGQSRLLGAAPADDLRLTRLCFLTAVCSTVQMEKDARAEGSLKTDGDAVEQVPAELKKPTPSPSVPSGMEVRTFRVRPDVFSVGAIVADPEDPFSSSAPEPTFMFGMSAQNILKAQGIPFPEGASATFNQQTSELAVVNLPANLELVDDYIASIFYDPPVALQFRLHVVEAGAAVVRKLARANLAVTDHRAAWAALQAEVAEGRGRVVGVSAIETRSGQRSSVMSGRSYAWTNANLTPQIPKPKDDKGSATITGEHPAELVAEVELEPLGQTFEVDTALGADGLTIDVNAAVSRQSREPTEHFTTLVPQDGVVRVDAPAVDFHPLKLATAFTTMDGMWRMIGTWQPMGADGKLDPAVMQAVFIQAVVLRVGE